MKVRKALWLGGLALVATAAVLWMRKTLSPEPATEPPVAASSHVAPTQDTASPDLDNPSPDLTKTASPPAADGADMFGVFSPREGEREVASQDPRSRTFVDAAGQVVRRVRTDPAGNPLLETRNENGQVFTVERIFGPNNELLRERRLLNGALLKETEFR